MCYNSVNGNLYIATYVSHTSPPEIAVWNGVSWTIDTVPASIQDSFPNLGTWFPVSAICNDNQGNIYIGGLTQDSNSGIGVSYVLKWDGNNWTVVGNIANAFVPNLGVYSMSYDHVNNYLYASLYPYTFGPQVVIKWDGSNWSQIGSFSDSSQNAAAAVFNSGGNLFATAYMSSVSGNSGIAQNNIDEWNGSSWVPLDNIGWLSAPYTFYNNCIACSGPGNKFYTIGIDTSTEAACVYEWNGAAWHILGTGNNGLNVNGPVYCVFADNAGNVYVSGDYYDSNGYRYILKWDGNAWNELGVNNLALHANNWINLLAADSGGNIYAAGDFATSNGLVYVAEYQPMLPGREYVFLYATPANCGNTGSITSSVYNGIPPYTYTWSNGQQSPNIDSLASGTYYVTVTDANKLMAIGDIFVSGNCQSIISGTVFFDTAGTCIYNGQQPGVSNVILTLSGDTQTLYATTDVNGNYSFAVGDTGNYYLYIQVGSNSLCGNYALCGNPSQIVHLSVLGDTVTGNNFALTPDSSSFDLYLHPGWTSADPGFGKDYWVYFANNSPIPFNGTATVTFKYDTNLTFISSDTPYTSYNAASDSITWVVNNFNNYGWNFIGNVHFNVPSTLPLGYQLHSQFWIYPYVGDCDTSNNYLQYYETVKGSHDPNYKEVSPAGYSTAVDSVLTYTIHYQNTGTDSTYFIVVKDTLSPYLNPATVRNLASSDSYSSFSISGTGILTWTFVPLSLPAASTDSTGSKGFITFSVHRMANVPLGTEITNSASVYFDYNSPVQTNQVTDTVINTCTDTISQFGALCAGDSVYFYGRWIRTPGSYDTLVVGNPCDTFATLGLVVQDPLPPHHISDTICSNDSLLFAGTYLHTTGTYSHIGCDSSVILSLTVLQAPLTTITQTTCWDQPYYGHDTSGQYIDTFTASNGCDSIRILNLTVTPATITYDTVNICHGQSYLGYSATGNYTDTITGINGCDKIRYLNLTVLPALTGSVTASVCQGQSYQGHTSTGTYTDTLTGSNNCDSIVTLQLTVLSTELTNINESICDGASYSFNDSAFTLSGVYTDSLTGINGCDSIVVLNLTVLPNPIEPYITQQSDSLISNEPTGNQWYFNDTVLPGDTSVVLVVNRTGNYQVQFTGPNGCQNMSAVYDYLGTGIQLVQNAFSVTLYPNPNNGNFIVGFSDNTAKDITVTDMIGQTVVPSRRVALKTEFDLSLLADGVYQLKVTDVQNSNRVVFKRLVIQH